MRIHSVEAVNRQTGDKRVFNFGSGKNTELLTVNGASVNNYIAFALCGNVHCNDDVNLIFTQDEQKYLLKRSRSGFNTFAQIGKVEGDQYKMLVEGEDVDLMLAELLGGNPASMVDNDFIDQSMIDSFDGNLSVFKNIDLLVNVLEENNKEKAELLAKRDEIKNSMKQLRDIDAQFSSRKIVDLSNEELRVVNEQIVALTNKANEMRNNLTGSVLAAELSEELKQLTAQYDKLMSEKASIENQRQAVKTAQVVKQLVPDFERLEELKSAEKEYSKNKDEVAQQIALIEKKLQEVNAQIASNGEELESLIDARQRFSYIGRDVSFIKTLQEKNEELRDKLEGLRADESALVEERDEVKRRLESIGYDLMNAQEGLSSASFPKVTVSSLLDVVRLNIMREEIRKHSIELEVQIEETEQQLVEIEGVYQLQMKRFQAVTELDSRMNSIKAKDTIMQVLDSKINKLTVVNNSLIVKKRNLQQTRDEYNKKLEEISFSKATLEKELARVLDVNQEEYKRELLFNTRKLQGQDPSNILAIQARLETDETLSLRQEIEKRSVDHDQLLEKQYSCEGRIQELERQIEMNEAELTVLRKEKQNIEDRYQEIIDRNRNDDVNNYLQSLETNTSTQYLLQSQEDAIRNSVEINNKYALLHNLRGQLSEARARINHLESTQEDIESDTAGALEKYIGDSEHVKNALEESSTQMVASFEEYMQTMQEVAQLDEKILSVQGDIMEIEKTISVHETQIEECNQNIKNFGDFESYEDASTAVASDDIALREEQSRLTERKRGFEHNLYELNNQQDKVTYNLEMTKKDIAILSNQIDMELVSRKITMQDVELYKDGTKEQGYNKAVEEFDIQAKKLEDAIESTKRMLEKQPMADADEANRRDQELMAVERELNDLNTRKRALEQTCQENMEKYVQDNNAKLRYAIVATEANTLGDINKAIQKNEMLQVLADDKIKNILNNAQRYLRIFSGLDLNLGINGRMLTVSIADETATYPQLKAQLKAQVYLSLVLGVPRTETTVATWILLSDDIKIPHDTLQEMMTKVRDFDHLIG